MYGQDVEEVCDKVKGHQKWEEFILVGVVVKETGPHSKLREREREREKDYVHTQRVKLVYCGHRISF